MLPAPHPFARFIRLLGRGKTLARALTIDEAEEAMGMIWPARSCPSSSAPS